MNLKGKKVIITSGGTREPIDPVRVITNKSSGKMGKALKKAVENCHGEVIFIEAETVAQLKTDIAKNFDKADILIMAAAISDYRPIKVEKNKIKSGKEKLIIELEKTEDLLKCFSNKKSRQYLVGFCLETENLEENALKKLKAKNLDLMVANDYTAIGADKSSIVMIDRDSQKEVYNNLDKKELAEKIVAKICRDLNQ